METGRDLKGKARPELTEKLERLRLIIIPLANPDGRVRVPYDGWVGLPTDEMTVWGQGTAKDGEPYKWRRSKAFHPMTGDVGILGGYFDDAGVNMMHDDWADPMSATTRAILKLAAKEGPDCLLNLHTHGHPPGILPTRHVPVPHEKRLHAFNREYRRRMAERGLRTMDVKHWKDISEETREHGEAPFNLQSMLYHVGADFGCLFETAHGTIPHSPDYDYDKILESHYVLFELAAEEILRKGSD